MDLGIKGKKDIITGGATEMGKQFVLGLAKEGDNVAFTYMSEKEKPEQTVEKVHAINPSLKAVPVLTNLEDEKQIVNSFYTALQMLVIVYIVFNNAGIWLS